MTVVILSGGAGVAVRVLSARLFEDVFHRGCSINPDWLRRPHDGHVFLQHRIFGGDAAYQVQHDDDRQTILVERWQASGAARSSRTHGVGLELATRCQVSWGGMTVLAAYSVLYEYLHWAMHNPAGRRIERTRIFWYLDRHHRLHHRRWWTNVNVMLLLGDLVFGIFRAATPGGGR